MTTLFLALFLATSTAPALGDPAPPAPFTGLEGSTFALERGKTTMVCFVAPWCQACHAALTDLFAIRRARHDFTLLLVVLSDDHAEVVAFLRNKKIPNDVVLALDPANRTSTQWGVDQIPTTFVLDRQGNLARIHRGYGRGFRARLRRWLRELAQ